MNLMHSRVSPSGSFGFPKMIENSGTIPNWRIRAARAADGFERGVGIFHHDVSAAFAPPSHAQRSHAVCQFASVFFPQEKVVVIELDGINAVGLGEVTQHRFGPSRRFHFFPAAGKIDYSAKITPKRTPDTGLVNHAGR